MTLAPETDQTAPPSHTLQLVAGLFAEEHILIEWSRDTQHPRLATAYHALQARIGGRCKDVREAWEARYPDSRRALLDATLAAHETGAATRFELSRLKALLAARRDRSTHEEIPGYAAHRAAEDEESAILQGLLSDLARGLC